ncbi:DNA phosphorothioation-dependent restriction protein DptH [Enterobacter sichuanensis]|uniref:DNA phosphorothioation-dependent restriction protein DptH n=1 Tax=Enterobacter sichuanensis TaxID=2071710 RepID=UPI002DB939EF|nr:DNA phosphorothioation-dependent restriction protein DptH [Enterobacter sichuanensis]MEB5961964.1 DNA phosphorothioation-dependent restriction protein DptH [Enterobacter sichuanensis]
MSVRPFEHFLVEQFIEWVSDQIQPGSRYQFKSPSAENGAALYNALIAFKDEQLLATTDGISLPYIMCNGIKVLPVLHDGEDGFTENYISRLRDLVAGRSGEFEKTALLIIHNSMLDTLINSAFDLGGENAVWHPGSLSQQLAGLINKGSNHKELSACLLEEQLSIITAEGATVFGFAPLFSALEDDGKLDFDELHLFDDPAILNWSGNKSQISKRLQMNRKLRSEIEEAVEHYDVDQLESVLKEFSSRFIRQYFQDESWRTLEFETYLKEIDANKAQKILLEEITVDGGILQSRTKSQTKAGQRDLSVIIQLQPEQRELALSLTFIGNDLDESQFKLMHNAVLKKQVSYSINRSGGKRCRVIATLPVTGEPTFFSLELKRDNRSEEYKFRCLVVEQGNFYFDELLHCFRIDSSKNWLTLMLEDNKFRINPDQESCAYLSDEDSEVDFNIAGWVDFEAIAEQGDQIRFDLKNGERSLPINIEGPTADESICIPLLFDKDRFAKILRDDRNAEYHREKGRVIFDNNESSVVGIRQQLLNLESLIVDERILYSGLNNSSVSLSAIRSAFPNLHNAYEALFDYLKRNKTVPSLVAWGDIYCALVQGVLDAYEEALLAIPVHAVLTIDHKQLLRIGLFRQEERQRVSPLHPLVLSYHQQLVKAIKADRNEDGVSSFAELPDVTRERLVASGLLPFVYDNDSGYAHLLPVRENNFWLDVVPQKQESYSYIKRLVRDKLDEFTKAYARLFSAGEKSTLIVNAINQSTASEFFLGLIEHFKTYKEKAIAIHVNFYDERLQYNDFDLFAETAAYDDLKKWLGLNTSVLKAEADMLIDLIRSRLTYSKFTLPKTSNNFAYAHLAFFRNQEPVECHPIKIDESLSGVLCDGLIAGEAAETQGGAYFTAFGLRGVDYQSEQSLRIARLLGNLWQPASQSNSQYLETSIGLAVSANFKELLTRSYDSALWTTIIDPKVTLDFFTSQQDVVLIHYSDQYTSASGYDAITVTKQVDLFKRLIQKDGHGQGDTILSEFNAFNGEWLLKMLTSNDKERKEKNGIIGAYKFVSALLHQSDICWIPLSVAEMIRVSGNVGLKMSDSEFSRHVHGYRKGAISDDVLFVGFKGKELYLLPLEVKTGSKPDFNYAGQQALELKRYLTEEVLGPNTLACRLYRGLFIRQVLMQVDKFCLYQVMNPAQLAPLLSMREWWLKGEYSLAIVPGYANGFVVAHIDSSSFFIPQYKMTESGILQVELPYALLTGLIQTSAGESLDKLVTSCHVDKKYMLVAENKPVQQEHKNAPAKLIENQYYSTDINTADTIHANISNDERVTIENIEGCMKEPMRILFGHEALRQTPLYWEPTNTARFMNTNTGIIGTMGTGKTQFTKSLITQLMRLQTNNVNSAPIGLLIFDYKSDYVDEAFSEANQSKRLRLHQLPYNPLSLYGDMPMLPVHTATGFAETLAKAFGLGPKQQLRLRKLILDAYELAGISKSDNTTWSRPAPTLAQVWDLYLEQEKVEEDSLYAALDSLVTYEIFETMPESVCSLYELLDGVTVIELAGYSPQIQNLVVALTLDLFYSQMQKRGKPMVDGDYRQITKMILVDEADNFMSQDFPSLRKILKEGREYGVGVILSTQDLSHFKTGENNYGSYILTWVVHRVAEIKNADIKSIFNKDDKGEQEQLMETIRKLDKHFSLYIDGDKNLSMMRDKAFWELLTH